MRPSRRTCRALSAVAMVFAVLPLTILADPASAQSSGAYLDGAQRWTGSDCDGETPVVVASDARAQSDIYAAVTLAGVLDTDCVILAGSRDGGFPADELTRFAASDGDGYIVGGLSAISANKAAELNGRVVTRIAGASRWDTAELVGRVASGQDIDTDTTEPDGTETTATEFAKVSSGARHSCGVRTDGTIQCWGRTPYGFSEFIDDPPPRPSGSFSSVSAGNGYSCGVRTDGTVQCWGSSRRYGVQQPPSGSFSSVSAGNEHSCGVRTDGTVQCWGRDFFGSTSPPSGSFSSVSAGNLHSCGVRTDGTVECWGEAGGAASPPSGSFSSVSAGDRFLCGARTDGTVECWGTNSHGQASPPSG